VSDDPVKVAPRRRRTKAEIAEDKRLAAVAQAERLSQLLASAPPIDGEPLSPPAYIADQRLSAALVVWRELAPRLVQAGRVTSIDRDALAMLCYWKAEWIAAIDDIATTGYSMMGRATAGGVRPWTNPSVERRDTAASEIGRLEAKFGLTPLDRVAINRGVREGLLGDQDLFGFSKPPSPKADQSAEPSASRDGWSELLDPGAPKASTLQ